MCKSAHFSARDLRDHFSNPSDPDEIRYMVPDDRRLSPDAEGDDLGVDGIDDLLWPHA